MAATITGAGDPDTATVAEPLFFVTRRELVVLSVALAVALGAVWLLIVTSAEVAAALARPG